MLYKYHKLKPNGGRLKAQSSLEFILIFALLLTVLAVGATVGSIRIYGVGQANKDLEVSKVLDDVTSKINLAFLEGDGFQMKLNVPKDILGQNYTIEIQKNNVIITFENSTYAKSLLTENITGNIAKGMNTLTNKESEVRIT